jgi:hypothetical protein
MEMVVEEGRKVLPNGAVVQKSIYPKERLEFNQWAAQMGVSSSYVEKPEPVAAMRMIREYSVKGGLGFM